MADSPTASVMIPNPVSFLRDVVSKAVPAVEQTAELFHASLFKIDPSFRVFGHEMRAAIERGLRLHSLAVNAFHQLELLRTWYGHFGPHFHG